MVLSNSQLSSLLGRELDNLVQEAAALTGQSVNEFVVSTLTEASHRVVQHQSMTVLSDRDRDLFLALLDADAEPNEALKQAAKRFWGKDV